MQFIKNFFNDDSPIGLSGLRKKDEYVKVTIPEDYKRTFIQNTNNNFFLL